LGYWVLVSACKALDPIPMQRFTQFLVLESLRFSNHAAFLLLV